MDNNAQASNTEEAFSSSGENTSEEYRQDRSLSAEGITRMQDLEREMGVILLAWYQQPAEYAKLSDIQVKKLQELERFLETTVVAYRP